MKNELVKKIGGGVLAISMVAMFAQIRVYAQDKPGEVEISNQQAKENSPARPAAMALEGSWTTEVTFRVCPTGAAIRSFPAMNTFVQGGTMQEFGVGSGLFRGPGHGVWSHLGDRRYYSSFQFFRFNTDGTPAGSVRARRYMEVDLLGRTFSSNSTTEFYDNNGTLFMTGCATEVGVRFQ